MRTWGETRAMTPETLLLKIMRKKERDSRTNTDLGPAEQSVEKQVRSGPPCASLPHDPRCASSTKSVSSPQYPSRHSSARSAAQGLLDRRQSR